MWYCLATFADGTDPQIRFVRSVIFLFYYVFWGFVKKNRKNLSQKGKFCSLIYRAVSQNMV